MVFIRRTGRPCTSSCSRSRGLPIACLHPDLGGLHKLAQNTQIVNGSPLAGRVEEEEKGHSDKSVLSPASSNRPRQLGFVL